MASAQVYCVVRCDVVWCLCARQVSSLTVCAVVCSVRPLEQFYKLFLIDPLKRESTQLCPFVKNGAMHRNFQKYLRPDGLGIDYSQLKNFDTARSLEEVFANQRGPGEQLLRSAMNKHDMSQLDWAIENAKRIGIDKVNPALYNEAVQKRKAFGGNNS